MKLRKLREYSQEALAKKINLPRPSLAQIETGNQSVSAEEILLFSHGLEFSIDSFLSPKFAIGANAFSKNESSVKSM